MAPARDLSAALSEMLRGFGDPEAEARRDAFEETAAILEFDFGLSRSVAEAQARALLGVRFDAATGGPDPPTPPS